MDSDSLPSDIEDLKALLVKEDKRLRDVQEEERKRRGQRILARKRTQAGRSATREEVAAVPTPCGASASNDKSESVRTSAASLADTTPVPGGVSAEPAERSLVRKSEAGQQTHSNELAELFSQTRQILSKRVDEAMAIGRPSVSNDSVAAQFVAFAFNCSSAERALREALACAQELAEIHLAYKGEAESDFERSREILAQLQAQRRAAISASESIAEKVADEKRRTSEAIVEADAAEKRRAQETTAEVATSASEGAGGSASTNKNEVTELVPEPPRGRQRSALSRVNTPSVSPKKRVCILADSVEVVTGGNENENSDPESDDDEKMEQELQELQTALQDLQSRERGDKRNSTSQKSSSSEQAAPSEPEAAKGGKGPPGKGAPPSKGKGKGPTPPPAKGKGSGKGMPPGNVPPPPKAKADGKGGTTASRPSEYGAKASARKPGKLVSLHWKASHQPDDLKSIDDSILKRLEKIEPPRTSTIMAQDSPSSKNGKRMLPPDIVFPEPPATVFAPSGDLIGLPSREILDDYFTKQSTRSNWKQSAPSAAEQAPADDWRKSMLDPTSIQMLGILVKKHVMENGGESAARSVAAIRRAVLHCDFRVARVERLVVLRRTLRAHESEGGKMREFVRLRGEAALDDVEHPHLHQMIWKLCKIPQIDERLDCMLYQISFKENFDACWNNIQILRQVFQMLNAKREPIQKLFLTAFKLAQSLSRGATSAPCNQEGFQLSTLEKFSQTKSTKFPKFSILHFVLALVSPREASELFNGEDLVLLQKAKSLGTHKVYTDCVDLAHSMYGVQNVCESGMYTKANGQQAVRIERRRKSIPARPLSSLLSSGSSQGESGSSDCDTDQTVDTDDRFHEVLGRFVKEHLALAEDIAEGAFEVILLYKELALYFNDLNSVYPPPKSDVDPRKDLCEIVYNFAEEIRKHRDEVESERLRDIIAMSADSAPPNSARSSIPNLGFGASPKQQLSRQQTHVQRTSRTSRSVDSDWVNAFADSGGSNGGSSTPDSRSPSRRVSRTSAASTAFGASRLGGLTPNAAGQFELIQTPKSSTNSPGRGRRTLRDEPVMSMEAREAEVFGNGGQ